VTWNGASKTWRRFYEEVKGLAEEFVLRPRLDTWLGRVVLPTAFLVLLGLTALNLGGWNNALMWLILTLIPTIGLVGGAYAMPVLLGRVVVNRHGIGFHVDGMRLRLDWRDVRAAQITKQDGDPYLVLGVASGLYVLPIHLFDVNAVWKGIVAHAPAESVRPEALEPYERRDGNEGISPSIWLVGVLRVMDHRGLVMAGALGMAGFLLLFIIALLTSQPGGPLYLAFSVLYLLVLTGVGVTEFDLKGVTRRTLFGVTRISWDELSAIEMGPFGLRIVLVGLRGRRLVLFGPPMWTGPDAARAVHFLALQISTRRLIRRRSMAVLIKISRNTRIDGE
jgi:hypothetical protein